MTLRISPKALDDIAGIRAYLLPRSPQGAERVRRPIAADLDFLGRFPRSGRATDIADVRVLPVVRYPSLIYYTVSGDEIIVVHVRHSSRDAPALSDF